MKAFFFCLALAAFTLVQAADSPVVPPPDPELVAAPGNETGATLRYFNRELMQFRSTLFGYTPAERAEAARKRLDAALAGRADKLTVSTKSVELGHQIQINGSMMFYVTAGDINPVAGETPEMVVERTQERLRDILDSARAQRSSEVLLTGVALTSLATLIFLLSLRYGRRALKLLHARVDALLGDALDRKLSKLDLLRRDRLTTMVGWLHHLSDGAFLLVLSYLWATFSLKQFPYTAPWGEELQTFLLATAGGFARGIAGAIPGVLVVGLIAWLTWLLIRFSNYAFSRIEEGSLDLPLVDRHTAAVTRKLVAVVFVLFGLAAAYPYLPGSNSEAFKGLSVLAGLMVSIGASSIVGQAAAGLIIVYSRAFKPGDFVAIGEHEGRISGIGMFSTRLQAMSGEIALPNALVVGSAVRNYSRSAGNAGVTITTAVTIGYDTPWRQVHALLLEAAARMPELGGEPAPFVRQTALSDFYVEYKLVASAPASPDFNRSDTLSRLHAHIQDAFNEHGVQIMSPHYEADPALAKVVPKDQWAPAPASQEGHQ